MTLDEAMTAAQERIDALRLMLCESEEARGRLRRRTGRGIVAGVVQRVA